MSFQMNSNNEKVPLYGAAHERLQSCKYLETDLEKYDLALVTTVLSVCGFEWIKANW